MVKRCFDILISFCAIIILTPIFIIVAFLVYIKLGRPIYFCQPRPGQGGIIFNIIKFRTMTNARDDNGLLLEDQDRLTPFGNFLRTTSLDELPNLWNVLVGKMSLVGPRPLLVEYLPLYNDLQAKRHNVRPGITGLAQVSGRNNLSWPAKFDLDISYVNDQSLFLDLKIICLTFYKVIRTQDISADGFVTMEKFKGNDLPSGHTDE